MMNNYGKKRKKMMMNMYDKKRKKEVMNEEMEEL